MEGRGRKKKESENREGVEKIEVKMSRLRGHSILYSSTTYKKVPHMPKLMHFTCLTYK